MTTAILLSNTATDLVGSPVRLNAPSSVTLQFTPLRDGFTALVLVEVALVANVTPGYLWYSIATIGLDPWFPAANLDFSNHTTVVAFTLRLDPGARWIRASVSDYFRGTVSGYIAY